MRYLTREQAIQFTLFYEKDCLECLRYGKTLDTLDGIGEYWKYHDRYTIHFNLKHRYP